MWEVPAAGLRHVQDGVVLTRDAVGNVIGPQGQADQLPGGRVDARRGAVDARPVRGETWVRFSVAPVTAQTEKSSP